MKFFKLAILHLSLFAFAGNGVCDFFSKTPFWSVEKKLIAGDDNASNEDTDEKKDQPDVVAFFNEWRPTKTTALIKITVSYQQPCMDVVKRASDISTPPPEMAIC